MKHRTSIGIGVVLLIAGIFAVWHPAVRSFCAEALYPFQRVGLWACDQVGARCRAAWRGLLYGIDERHNADEVDRLRVLLNETLRETALVREEAQVKTQAAAQQGGLIPAQIISHGGGLGAWPTLTLNIGSNAGVRENDIVLVPEGLVGRISANVTRHRSTVILLSDPGCRVAVEVPGITNGILMGSRGTDLGTEEAEDNLYAAHPFHLLVMNRDVELQPGQQVFTEGSGGLFPRGLTVGTILSSSDSKKSPLVREAWVAPAVDPALLRTVFILRRATNDDR